MTNLRAHLKFHSFYKGWKIMMHSKLGYRCDGIIGWYEAPHQIHEIIDRLEPHLGHIK